MTYENESIVKILNKFFFIHYQLKSHTFRNRANREGHIHRSITINSIFLCDTLSSNNPSIKNVILCEP